MHLWFLGKKEEILLPQVQTKLVYLVVCCLLWDDLHGSYRNENICRNDFDITYFRSTSLNQIRNKAHVGRKTSSTFFGRGYILFND